MEAEVAQLFKEVFGVDINTQPTVAWLTPLHDYIRYDKRFRQFSFALSHLDTKAQNEFVRVFNRNLQRAFQSYETDYFRTIKHSQTEETLAIVGEDVLRRYRDMPGQSQIRFNARALSRYYEDSATAELLKLASDAFNLDLVGTKELGKERGASRIMLTPLFDDHDEELICDYGLIFCTHDESIPINGYGLLARDLEQSIGAAAQFLDGSEFYDGATKDLTDILNMGNENSVFVREPVNPDEPNQDYFLPMLRMSSAKKLVDAGVGLDLGNVAERYLNDRRGIVCFLNQEQAASKALYNRLNLASLINGEYESQIKYNDRKIVSFQSSASLSSGYWEMKTGRPSNGDNEPVDVTKVTFKTILSFSYLTDAEIEAMRNELNDLLGTIIPTQTPTDFFYIKDGYTCPSLHISYDHIDFCLRQNLTVDALPIFEKYNALQTERLDAAQSIMDKLGKISGYRGWSSLLFPQDFYRNKSKDISLSLRLERQFRTSEADFPKPSCMFADDTRHLRQALLQHGLSDAIEVSTNAVRWAGGVTGHIFSMEIKVKSLEHAQEVMTRLEAVQDVLRSTIESVIARSPPTACFNEDLFDCRNRGFFDDSYQDRPEYKKMISMAYGSAVSEIETLRRGSELDKLNDDLYRQTMESVDSYIRYLVDARSSQNADIRMIAENHLGEMAPLSPAFASLIEKAQAEVTDLAVAIGRPSPSQLLQNSR